MTMAISSQSAMAGPHAIGSGVVAKGPGPIAFTMPTPPSANHLFKNIKGVGRVKASHYDDFIRMGVAAIRRQNVPNIEGRVLLVIGVERMSDRADIDNRLKALLDAIVASEVIDDDSLVTGLVVSWLPKANGLSHVQIYPVQKMTVNFHPSQNGASGGWVVHAPQNTGDEDGLEPL